MNKTVLITGTSTGIGREAVIKFQKEGWNVVATMRSPEKEEELKKLDNVIVTKLDVQDLSSIDEAINVGISNFGVIDVIVNNAGYGLMGTFESASRESIQRQYDVNVFGLFDVTRAVLPHFRENKNGLFINISSVGGRMTFPITSLYHSTKFAVEGFTESVHYELAPLGIKAKIIEPGAVATDFGNRSLDFQHNEDLTEYNQFVSNIMETYQEMMKPESASTPDLIADIIYRAATDDKDQIRYRAGQDAEMFLGARDQMNDEEFIGMLKQNLKI